MSEPTIQCPKCRAAIPLTESLAAPLIEAARRDMESRASARDAELSRRESLLREQLASVTRDREALDEQVQARLSAERGAIAQAEQKKARAALSEQIEREAQQRRELEDVVRQKDARLADAAKAEAEARRLQRELGDRLRDADATVEKRVAELIAPMREKERRDADDQARQRLQEKDKLLADLQRQIEELKRKGEQGSQQLQGEVQELELESALRARFPRDTIEPVPKGEHGGDAIHRVLGASGTLAGTILWESKNTKDWRPEWLVKLREDARAAKADAAILVSRALPKSVESFDLVEGVWVVSVRAFLPVAMAVRQQILEVASARRAGVGQQTKMEMVYQYMTGPRFRQRVQAIVEGFTAMTDDLEKERRALTRQWEKRREQIDRVMHATVGMHGDLEAIAGAALPGVDGIDVKLLDRDAPLLAQNSAQNSAQNAGTGDPLRP